MKSKVLSYLISCLTIVFFFLLLSAPECQPKEKIEMTINLDGKEMERSLEEVKGYVCTNTGADLSFSFSAMYDPIEDAVDDEIYFDLEVILNDISLFPTRRPVDLEDISDITLTASVKCHCMPPLDPLTIASGKIGISSYEENLVDGSFMLTFTDPNNVNSVVKEFVSFDIEFSNLIVNEGCQ